MSDTNTATDANLATTDERDNYSPIELTVGGVRLYADIPGEKCYVDLRDGHSASDARLVEEFYTKMLGLEAIPEEEHPAETLDNGVTRVWLADII